MSGPYWEAIGAIAAVLALLLSVILEWERIKEISGSLRAESIGVVEGGKKVVTVVVERAWRFLLVILSVTTLGIWVRGNLRFQLSSPASGWTLFQHAFTVAQIVPLGLLIYIVIVEPWLRRRPTTRNLLARVSGEARMRVVPIVFYDETFPCSWVSSPEKAAAYFEAHGFGRVNASELGNLMETIIERDAACKTIVVFVHDIVPKSVAQVLDPTCTLKRFLDAGGRVVWWGDIPLHYRGSPGGLKETWQGGPRILSVNHYIPTQLDRQTRQLRIVLWGRRDLDGLIELTDAGRSIGLKNAGGCVRPAAAREGTLIYSELTGDLGFGEDFEEFRWAISWRRVSNDRYPHSGFMQYPLGRIDCNDQDVVRSFYQFSASDWSFASDR